MGEVIKTKGGEVEILETWKGPKSIIFCNALCFCDKIFSCRLSNILSGGTSSCGCLYFRHGQSGSVRLAKKPTSVYALWANMLSVCSDPNNPKSKFYIGKGINVCEEWLEFENFFKDVGERPSDYRFVRIDKDGDYEPDNCEWVPIKGKKRKL